MNSPRPNKPFAMIREFHLADWFTLANAVCGTGALFSVMTYLQTWDLRHIQFEGETVLLPMIGPPAGLVARLDDRRFDTGRL